VTPAGENIAQISRVIFGNVEVGSGNVYSVVVDGHTYAATVEAMG